MDNFKYTGLNSKNELIEGEIIAEDVKDARRKIREIGLIPTKLTAESELKKAFDYKAKGSVKTLSLQQKMSFTSELQTLLSSSIPILESLNSIEVNSNDKKIKVIAQELQNAIKSGMSFSESLDEYYGKLFGMAYISLTKAGESAGEIDKTLHRMYNILKKQDDIKGKIINASIYPVILLLMLFALLILFSKFVFPSLFGILSINGGELPPLAKAITEFLDFISNFWWLIILAIAGFIGFCITLLQNTVIKTNLDKIILKLPVISKFIEYAYLANYLAILETSYESGLTILNGLNLANDSITNLALLEKAQTVSNLSSEGKSLTEVFKESKLLPADIISIISAGEKSGNLGKMLKDTSDTMAKKVDMALEAMTKMFEPTVIIIIGIFIGIILLAFLQAYVSSLNAIL